MRRGYQLAADLVAPALHARLAAEAAGQFSHAVAVGIERSDGEDGRGGNPKRRLLTAPGGPVQQAWYHSAGLRRELEHIAGLPLRPTGGGGTYSYYVRPGDHISIHLDIVTCDFTVITCLWHTAGEGNAGHLVFWPDRRAEPLTSLRAGPAPGAELLRLEAGQSAVVFGGLIPHAVLPVRGAQQRVVSLLCFQTGTDPRPTLSAC